MDIVIETRELSKSFGGKPAVDDLTAQLVGYDFGDPRRRQTATGIGANSQGGHPILAIRMA